MKVIFIKDLPKMGKRLDLKEMPDGYARNFLIPKGFAIMATPAEIAKRDREVKAINDTKSAQTAEVESNFKNAADETLIIKAPANSDGHLFSGITTKIIAEHLKADRGAIVPEKAILLEHAIKSVGPHEVELQNKNKKLKLHILVEASK